MEISVFTLAFPGFKAEDVVSASARIGFDGVDIRTRQDGHIYIDATKDYRKELLDLAKSHSICFYGIYSYLGEGMASTEDSLMKSELKRLEAHIDLAVDLGATHVRIFDGGNERAEKNLVRFIESCKAGCLRARDKGVYIGIETHGNLAWDGESCRRIISETGSESLKIIFDPANIYCYGLNPIVEAEKIKEDILSVQFKDFVKLNHKTKYVLLGDGQVPVSEIIDFLKKEKFDGYIVVEYEKWWHPELPDPLVGLRHELSYLKKSFEQV